MRSKSVFILILFFSSPLISAQENLGFSNDQFSGINAATISPIQPFLNSNPWDINLFSADIFLQNDYLYISDQSFFGLPNSEIKSRSLKKNITGENTGGVLDFYNKDFGNYHFSSDVLGPSFSLKSKIRNKNFQLGLFSRLRTQTSAIKVDNYLKFGNQGITEPEDYNLSPFKLSMMNWSEIGFNVATQIFENSDLQWIIGANFKYEMGHDAVYVKSADLVQLQKTVLEVDGVPEKTIAAVNYNLEANIATNYNFETQKYELKKNGQGVGLDIGITVVSKDAEDEQFNFKVGFSILDVGKVNFQGERHVFKGSNLKIINNPAFDNSNFDSPNQYLELLSKEVYGNAKTSFQGTDFSMGLPTSIHANFSQKIRENHYLNFDWIQRTPIFENSLKRSNITNLSYIIQKPVIGYGASVSLYEYHQIQFGGYLRIGPLILGSSNVFPLIFKQKKLHSGDFFIALKIYPFWDSEMKRHRRADCNCGN